MNKKKKLVTICCLFLCLCLFSGCKQATEAVFATFIEGNLNEVYLGKTNETYLKLSGSTVEESKQIYLDGMEVQAEYFAYYWGIIDPDYGETYDDLEDELKQEILDLCKEIYGNAKFEVLSSTKQNDGNFAVKVTVEPVDIMELANNQFDSYEPLIAFFNTYTEDIVYEMTDEEYQVYTNDYGMLIVQLVKEQLPNLGYKETKTHLIQIALIDNQYIVSQDDWDNLDANIVYYP